MERYYQMLFHCEVRTIWHIPLDLNLHNLQTYSAALKNQLFPFMFYQPDIGLAILNTFDTFVEIL